MSKESLFHDFFHNPTARGVYSSCNMSFQGDKFYSYATVIGQKFELKSGPVLVVSSNNMSPTTSRHLSTLRRACPYPSERIACAPFKMGNYCAYSVDSIVSLFEQGIERFLEKRLSQAPIRREASALLYYYGKFRELFHVKKLYKPSLELRRLINEIEAKRNAPVDPVKAEKNRLARERKIAKTLEQAKDWSYFEKVKFCFDFNNHYSFLSQRERGLLRNALIAELSPVLPSSHGAWSFRYSFAWLSDDGNEVVTSQRVHLPVDVVRRAFRIWREHGIAALRSVGGYTFDEVSDSYFKIGCHYIPMKNILELEKALS